MLWDSILKPNSYILCETNAKLLMINLNCLWLQVPIWMQVECSQPHYMCIINMLSRETSRAKFASERCSAVCVCVWESKSFTATVWFTEKPGGHKTGHKPRRPGAFESNGYRLVLLIRSVLQILPQPLITAQKDAHRCHTQSLLFHWSTLQTWQEIVHLKPALECICIKCVRLYHG